VEGTIVVVALLGDRVGPAPHALGRPGPGVRAADQPEPAAGLLLPHPLLRRRPGPDAGAVRQVAGPRRRLGHRRLRHRRLSWLMACGREGRSTTTRPTRPLPLSLSGPISAWTSIPSGRGSCTTTSIREQGFVDFLDREFGRGLSVSFMANQVPQRTNRIALHDTVKGQVGAAGGLRGERLARPRQVPHGHARRAMRQRAPRTAGGIDSSLALARTTRPRTRWRGSPTTSSAGRGFGTDPKDSCSTPIARPGSSTTCTSPTGRSCRPPAAQPDNDHRGQLVARCRPPVDEAP